MRVHAAVGGAGAVNRKQTLLSGFQAVSEGKATILARGQERESEKHLSIPKARRHILRQKSPQAIRAHPQGWGPLLEPSPLAR
jgi:hypothetical protein